ncbi:MAG: PleD family two-component system response regulator [Pyrinomonadaceae bacterium]
MLAGRKLLLADDSVTIQKVIDLTFADEGVRVISFNNGKEAIDNVEEIAPDVVLADVFMPKMNGYEVCEYIKQNEKLKNIPVMLLVGSFEPFDEGEARRVGADDILTKPFQSIRRLIERVGALVGTRQPEQEIPTEDLLKQHATASEPALLTKQELEVTTADTQPLPHYHKRQTKFEAEPAVAETIQEQAMEPLTTPAANTEMETNDVLLDLGDFEAVNMAADDFELDLDLNEPDAEPAYAVAESSRSTYEPGAARAFVEPQISESFADTQEIPYATNFETTSDASYESTAAALYEDQVHETTPEPVYVSEATETPEVAIQPLNNQLEAPISEHVSQREAASELTPENLSPEFMDKIARRAVELLSEKVVQEIAWEVVPDLAELMIKRHLQEKGSQPK